MGTMIYVPGPLHPDLFGGDTPIMVPVEFEKKLFRVSITETKSRTYLVVADDQREAEDYAGNAFDDDDDGGNREVDYTRELDPEEMSAALRKYFDGRQDFTPPKVGSVLESW